MADKTMDINSFALYVHELQNQCVYAQASLNLFNQSLEQQSKVGAFLAAQSLMHSAAQVAVLLWPIRSTLARRGATLRQALRLPVNHPLNNRDLLTMWERPDEKLDDFITRTKGEQVLWDHIGGRGDVGDGAIREWASYRHYDPEKRELYFRGIAFNLQHLAAALADVAGRIQSAHEQLFKRDTPSAENGDAGLTETNAESGASAEAAGPENEPSETPEETKKKQTKKPAKKTPAGAQKT